MINVEIEWLCEFLQIPYNNKQTIALWKATMSNYIQADIGTVNYNISVSKEQLTIFDYDLIEQMAI